MTMSIECTSPDWQRHPLNIDLMKFGGSFSNFDCNRHNLMTNVIAL
jgi:hypothetical protein